MHTRRLKGTHLKNASSGGQVTRDFYLLPTNEMPNWIILFGVTFVSNSDSQTELTGSLTFTPQGEAFMRAGRASPCPLTSNLKPAA